MGVAKERIYTMADQQQSTSHLKSKQRHLLETGFASAVMGAMIGGLIGWSFDETVIGIIAGALYFAVAETVTDALRAPGEFKPLVHRIIGSTLFVAALTALIMGVFGSMSYTLLGLIIGALVGLFGLGPRKFLLGIGVGAQVGVAYPLIADNPQPALAGGVIVLAYRLLILIIFPNTSPFQIMGERVPAADLKYVVPYSTFEAQVGVDYMERLAGELNGKLEHNPAGAGLVESLDTLRGPHFDPSRVAPEIRDFYEHTSKYKLSIVPEWNALMQAPFWIFKTFVAQPIGQANLPFNMQEAQRGIVSSIDMITLGHDPEHIETIRAWIRSFEATGEAIYVGIYTVLRHEDVGYVSVGFPLPAGNFSATLLPYNNRGNGLLLRTRDTGYSFTGHYLSVISSEDRTMTTAKLIYMDEAIDVYLENGRLCTDHSFYFGGFKFLTLHYTINEKNLLSER
jgi:hypothetical protein